MALTWTHLLNKISGLIRLILAEVNTLVIPVQDFKKKKNRYMPYNQWQILDRCINNEDALHRISWIK